MNHLRSSVAPKFTSVFPLEGPRPRGPRFRTDGGVGVPPKASGLAPGFFISVSRFFLAVACSTILCPGIVRAESSGYDWMPAEAESAGLQSEDTAVTALPLTITKLPKPTADASKFTNKYTLELDKFGIHNDGTEAEATSKGLNAALQHAKTLKANHIVFPVGTYLISEKDPVIFDHQDTIVDLNGATLQIAVNGLPNYSVVQILPGAKNFRLTNGTIRGDRDEHDYKAAKGTHEGGACLDVVGGDNLEIDHLHLTKGTGDGVSISSTGARNRPELLERIYHNVTRKNLESGAFSEKGEKIDSTDKIRSIEPYEMGGERNRFELGFLAGYQGFPWIKGRVYQAYFFDADHKFLEKKQALQFHKVEVPAKAKYLQVEFNQPGIDAEAAHTASGEWMVRINNFTPSTDVHFHHNLMDENRRLGLTGAGQRWVIEENRFERNGGTPPAYGIDLEDGWEMMQDVVIRKNTFKGNLVGDLVVCAGSEILVEDNDFEKSVVFHGRTYNYTVRKNRFDGGSVSYGTRTGIATIGGNTYKNCPRVSIVFDGKGVADGLFRKKGENVATPALLFTGEVMEGVKKVGGSYLNFQGSTFRNTEFEAGDKTHLIRFENCTFADSSMNFTAKGPEVAFELKGNKGDLEMKGPGLARKIEK